MFFWAYSSLRQMHWMKINNFYLILRQEQEWFDENNAFEFATKVQAQLEQIEMGVGDRFGQVILMSSELISGLVVGFISSWKLTLMLLCCLPFIVGSFIMMMICMEDAMVLSRKTYEKAGGIAEELLYNIKTVTSFVNFDYEIHRFGVLIDKVEELEEKKAFISGISVGVIIFGIFMGYTVTLLFARKLIMDNLTQRNIISDGEYKDLEKQKISVGEIQKVLYGIIGSIVAIGQIAPNIQIIRAACAASSDYSLCWK
jgi:ABC-type multidrug transport system fused ATPase/permease subunit